MELDATAVRLRDEIEQAREALIRTSQESPGRWWTPRELKAQARNGASYGAANLALNGLIADGTFDVDKDKLRLNV